MFSSIRLLAARTLAAESPSRLFFGWFFHVFSCKDPHMTAYIWPGYFDEPAIVLFGKATRGVIKIASYSFRNDPRLVEFERTKNLKISPKPKRTHQTKL